MRRSSVQIERFLIRFFEVPVRLASWGLSDPWGMQASQTVRQRRRKQWLFSWTGFSSCGVRHYNTNTQTQSRESYIIPARHWLALRAARAYDKKSPFVVKSKAVKGSKRYGVEVWTGKRPA